MSIEVRNISKRFGDFVALHDVSFEVATGELVALLGLSGSGKTTLLRVIAGLEIPDAGSVHFHGEDASARTIGDRQVGFVFQHYALFRHMTVFENVAFGMRVKPRRLRPTEAQIRAKVHDLLSLVQLESMAGRYPSQLSGGQRQRVALARALINKPRVLLLDEPLGALDLKLRQQMQVELKTIQKEVGITFIFVTHDQEEALTMSDRIAVFSQGRIEQVGSPAEVYEHPASAFVAGFVGVSNLVSGPVAQSLTGSPGMFSIRPEKIHLADPAAPVPAESYAVAGRIREVVYLGMYTRYQVDLEGGGELSVMEQNLHTTSMDALAAQGREVRLVFQRAHIRLIPDKPAS